MALTDLSSGQLERLVQLIKEKETLQARLDRVNDSLNTLENGDISEAQTVQTIVAEALAHFGRIDTLVNNAGSN